MLKLNIWTEVGLVNRATGTVRWVIFHDCRLTAMSVCIIAVFDNYSDSKYEDNLVSVTHVMKTLI